MNGAIYIEVDTAAKRLEESNRKFEKVVEMMIRDAFAGTSATIPYDHGIDVDRIAVALVKHGYDVLITGDSMQVFWGDAVALRDGRFSDLSVKEL